MKKLLTFILITFICLTMTISFIGCKNPTNNEKSSDYNTPPTTSENSDDSNNPATTIWEGFGNGVGAYIPEPYEEYEINASSSYISIEVHNITESDFYDYVERCMDRGFIGNVGTANIPDIYFMAVNSDGYVLEVFYYETDSYFSIYASKK